MVYVGQALGDDIKILGYTYRVIHQVLDLSWVDKEFGCSTACLILLGLM